jgi:hypothetical protein
MLSYQAFLAVLVQNFFAHRIYVRKSPEFTILVQKLITVQSVGDGTTWWSGLL